MARSGSGSSVTEGIISGDDSVYILRSDAGPRDVTLNNVPREDWGYSVIDGVSCQLNATNHPGPPAELVAEINLTGRWVFDSEVQVENPLGHGVTFGISVHDVVADRLVIETSIDISAGQRQRLMSPIDASHETYRVTLWTRMLAGSVTNHQVRSYWHRPRFHR